MVRLLIKSIGNIISCIVGVDPSSLRYASCTVGNSSNWKDKLQVDWWGKVLRIVRRRVASRHNWLRALTVKVERCTHQCKSESCSLHSPANQHTTSLTQAVSRETEWDCLYNMPPPRPCLGRLSGTVYTTRGVAPHMEGGGQINSVHKGLTTKHSH